MDHRRAYLDQYAEEKTEVAFMREVLTPLFESMGFERVKFNHGNRELGKDYILSKTNEFSRTEYYAVVAKNGDIQNTNAKSKATLAEVERQIDQSFKIEIQEMGRARSRPSKVIVVCSGRISDSAEQQIIASQPSSYSPANVEFLSSEHLIPLIERHLPHLFKFEMPILGIYLEKLAEGIRAECCGDSQFSKIVGKFDLMCQAADPELSGNRSSNTKQNVRVATILENGKTIWLQGANGSGKTYSAFQFISQEVAEQKRNKEAHTKRRAKVFFYLNAAALRNRSTQEPLIDFLIRVAASYYKSITKDEIEDWSKKHDFVFVIERFEKTPDPLLIDTLIADTNAIGIDPTILLLSRVIGDIQYVFRRKPVIYYIRDLEMSDAVDLIKQSLHSKSLQAKSAFRDLVRNGVLERIPRTPLAINILSHVFSDEIESTPNNMYEFFDMFFELVLGRWRSDRKRDKAYDYMQVRSFLESAAYKIVETRETSIEITALLPIAEQILSGISDETTDPEEYIRELCNNSEITKMESDRFEFHHRTYLEFLSGCYYMKHKWSDESYISNIVDPDWEYTLIFAAGGKKESDSLLRSLDQVKEQEFEEKFFKIKNISLTLQALYHSQEASKLKALRTSLATACSLRDDPSFNNLIKSKFSSNPDLLASYVSLGMYASFYNRSCLAHIIEKHLQGLTSGRERAYLVSALCTTDNSDKVPFLRSYLAQFQVANNEPECLALTPFLKGMDKVHDGALGALKAVLNVKKIKRLGRRVQEYANPQKKWYSQFVKRAGK